MQASRDRWGDPEAWKQHQDSPELAHLMALAIVEHEERRTGRNLMRNMVRALTRRK